MVQLCDFAGAIAIQTRRSHPLVMVHSLTTAAGARWKINVFATLSQNSAPAQAHCKSPNLLNTFNKQR
ncbi:MAG: hypothetical protein IGR92_11610 [Leptolyngbyaceae cyanobacterium T60_A2020_046]|nr:hypothetical protein [Leptolyngbyaceae cyanobacterium T60_A2020_046]